MNLLIFIILFFCGIFFGTFIGFILWLKNSKAIIAVCVEEVLANISPKLDNQEQ